MYHEPYRMYLSERNTMLRRFYFALFPLALALTGLMLPSESGKANTASGNGVGSSPVSTCDPWWIRYSLPSPSGGWFNINGMDSVSSSDVWAVGESVSSASDPAPVLHWDGSTWTQVRFPGLVGAHLFGVAAFSSNDVWIGGYNEPAGRRML